MVDTMDICTGRGALDSRFRGNDDGAGWMK